MNKLVANYVMPIAALVAVAGCVQNNSAPTVTTAPAADSATSAVTGDAGSDSGSPERALPPLSYSWPHGFKGYVIAPVEIVRQGQNACEQRGFEVATIGTIGLDGEMATATFICRGDTE